MTNESGAWLAIAKTSGFTTAIWAWFHPYG
jgi:hypothetical protein